MKGHIQSVNKTIENVFDISNDTIIACKYENGLILSKDAGQSWTELKTALLFDEVTLSDNGYLIGLDSWQGIHEPDYSRLYLSKDFGKTWQTFSLDCKTFFPLHIISMPKEKVLVETVDNKVYQLNGLNLKTDWAFIKSVKPTEAENIKSCLPFVIDDYDDHRIKLFHLSTKKIDTLAILDKCRQVNNIISAIKFVYISGAGYNKSSGDETYAYYSSYNKKNGLKQYIIPGHYAYLKKTQLGRVYIMNDKGLFITNQDTLKKLY
ncbi:MAG: hypothetical protein ACM3H8_12515 [Sphingobacteriales bacterium]